MLRPGSGFSRWLIAGLALVCAALTHFGLHRSLINDEAVELSIADGMPLDGFYFFTPDTAYPHGAADVMESFSSYVIHGVWAVARPWLHAREKFIVPVRCLHIAVFAATCLLVFGLARRQWGTGRAALAAACLAGSGYALLMNQFLTRNALSLGWGAAVLWALDHWLNAPPNRQRVAYGWAAVCATALIGGCWTYTIFKPLAFATYAALFIGWLRFSRRRADLGPIAVSAALFAVGLATLVTIGGSSIELYFRRGSYAIGGGGQYLSNLWLTLATPFFYRAHGPFLEEDVHVMLGRATLSPLLWPFFAVGLVGAFISRRPGWFVGGALWVIGMAICAIAGPNLKYQHAYFPLTLLIACGGLFAAASRLPSGWLRAAAAVFLAGYFGIEGWAIFKQFPTSDRIAMNQFARQIAEQGMDAAGKAPGQVLLQPGVGFDILNWYLWPPERAAAVRAFSSPDDLIAGLAAHPSPPPILLLTDYPPESLYPDLHWTPPPGLKIVNVREP